MNDTTEGEKRHDNPSEALKIALAFTSVTYSMCWRFSFFRAMDHVGSAPLKREASNLSASLTQGTATLNLRYLESL